jgi:hypothetical protein
MTSSATLASAADGTARVSIGLEGARAAKTITNAQLNSLKDKDRAGIEGFEMFIVSKSSNTTFIVANDDGDKIEVDESAYYIHLMETLDAMKAVSHLVCQ